MNWKNRFTNYNFWISIVSAVLLILQAFEFQFDIMYINEIATAVLGLLVVIGIINDPTKTSVKVENNVAKKESKKEVKEEIQPIQEETLKVEEMIKTEEIKSKEKIENAINENENLNTAEHMQENFPINEQGEIDVEYNENDFKNIIKEISADINEEENNFKEMFKNLLNLLKDNEKTGKNLENSQNFPKNEEDLTEIKLTETEIEPAESFEERKEIVKENIEEITNEAEQIIELQNDKNVIQLEKQTEVPASSFNIVN